MHVIYTSEPLYFLLTIAPQAGSNVTTFIGGTVQVDAINLKTRAKVAGTATILSALTASCLFPAGSFAPGNWEVQALATPPGGFPQVLDFEESNVWHVKPGAAP